MCEATRLASGLLALVVASCATPQNQPTPNAEDGTLSILPDGRMRALFRLRQGVTWHDGAPFTAQDVAFSHRVSVGGGIPPGFTGRREEISEVLSVEAAWAMLPASDALYPAVKDGLRPFSYDPARALSILAEVGWAPGTDRALRHSSDGRSFRTAVWGTPGRDQETALYSAYWRALGIDVDEVVMAPALYWDPSYVRTFPGWNFTGTDVLDFLRNPAASPQNNWQGNINGWEDPRGRSLVDALQTTIVEREQLQAWKAIDDFLAAELPVLPIYRGVVYTAAQKRVKAFDDIAGAGGERIPPWYGGYARNAYLWDIEVPAS